MLMHYGVKGMKWKDHDYVEPEISEEDFNTLKDIMSGSYKGPMSSDEQSAFIQRVGYAKSASTGKTFMAMSNAEILDKLKNSGAMAKPLSSIDPKALTDGKDKVDDTLKKKGSTKTKKDGEAGADGEKKGGGGGKKGGGGGGEDAKKAEKEAAATKKKEEQEARKIELLKLKEEREAIRKEKEEIRALLENSKKEALEAKKQAALREADVIVKRTSKYSNTGLKRG